MKKILLTIVYVVAFVGGFLALFLSGRSKEQAVPVVNQTIQQANLEQNLESKTDEQASVTVTVTPINIAPKSKEWKFDVLLDTHSVELDQEITEISVLFDDQGKKYKPIRWEGAEAGGHHREGVLVFNQISPLPESLELKISEIGGVIRSFKWQF